MFRQIGLTPELSCLRSQPEGVLKAYDALTTYTTGARNIEVIGWGSCRYGALNIIGILDPPRRLELESHWQIFLSDGLQLMHVTKTR